MATSSITANFHTDDPKAANAIVRALFSSAPSAWQMPERTRSEARHTPSDDRAFFERGKRRIHSCQPT